MAFSPNSDLRLAPLARLIHASSAGADARGWGVETPCDV
ncbi:hypothetical protein E1H18_793 [Caulobacter sp. RHG1]|nr:hypothetical protein [Caulobacter sp. RHG1]